MARDDVERLRTLPIDLGFHDENWSFTQDVCVWLSGHPDPWVCSNSLLGLTYAARFRGKVEKSIVMPVLLRALKDADSRGVAQEAIDDLNHLMKWIMVGARRQKAAERRHEPGKTGSY